MSMLSQCNIGVTGGEGERELLAQTPPQNTPYNVWTKVSRASYNIDFNFLAHSPLPLPLFVEAHEPRLFAGVDDV